MRPIFLYTGQRSGTMYCRHLLECHRQVGPCVMENQRVDTRKTKGYKISRSYHRRGETLPANETTFAHLVTAWLRGEIPTLELLSFYDHWKTGQVIDNRDGLTPYQQALNSSRAVRRHFFGEAHGKVEDCRLFFHEHLRWSHQPSDFACLRDVDVVTTLRHPLLVACSMLRVSGSEQGIWQQWTLLERLINVPNVIFYPVDHPDSEQLRRRLGLANDQWFSEAASRRVVINRTSKGGGKWTVRAKDQNPELLKARAAVRRGKLPAILKPYWTFFRRSRLLPFYEAAGYDFGGL